MIGEASPDHAVDAVRLKVLDVGPLPPLHRAVPLRRMGESQPLVCLEAQASARVLLASDIPAAREVVRDGQTGLLFRAGDVDDLAAKTLAMAADAARRRAIGRTARAHVRAHGVDRIVNAYAETLAEVVAEARRRRRGGAGGGGPAGPTRSPAGRGTPVPRRASPARA